MGKDKRVVKPRKGHSPDLLRKGSAHRDRSKYTRKEKHRDDTKALRDDS